MQKFEDVVALVKSESNPMRLAERVPMFAEGLQDLANRLSAIEQGYLENKFRSDRMEDRVAAAEVAANGVASDHAGYKTRVEAVEKAPAEQAKRLDDLEKRTRTVEGAVGSSKLKPDEPKADPRLDQRANDQRTNDQRTNDPRTDQRTDQRANDPRTDQRANDQRTNDPRANDQRTNDPRPGQSLNPNTGGPLNPGAPNTGGPLSPGV